MKDTGEIRYLISGYLGIQTLDEYELKVYILKEIDDYIKALIKEKKLKDFNYEEEKNNIDNNYTITEKLNDSLLTLKKINAPMELFILIKRKIKEIKKEELLNQKIKI